MPTGYTDVLDSNNKSTKDWILEDLARAFGICIMMRDDIGDFTKEEILEKIKDDSTYHETNLEKSKKQLEEYKNFSHDDWMNLMKKENEAIVKSNEKSIKKANKIKKIHDKTKADLILVMNGSDDDITKNICKYGLEQLERVEKYDCEPYISELHNYLIDFINDKIDSTKRSIKYHTDEMIKQEERNKERVEGYLNLISNVERILG